MQARTLLQLTDSKIGNVSNRIQLLRREINSATGLSPRYKQRCLQLLDERAQLLSTLSVKIKNTHSATLSEAKAHAVQLLDIDDDVTAILDSFEKTQPHVTPNAQATRTTPASTAQPAANVSRVATNPKLEAAKRELTHSYMDAHAKFTRMQGSLKAISQTVLPSSMAGLTIEQKSQRIAFANSLKEQYKQIEAKVTRIEKTLGLMSASLTSTQIAQMKNDIKEISDVSEIIETRIAREQAKAMPIAPRGFKKNPPPDEDPNNNNQFRRR